MKKIKILPNEGVIKICPPGTITKINQTQIELVATPASTSSVPT